MNHDGLETPHSHEILVRIEEVCERFEQEWQTGHPPEIEDYLADWAEPARATLLEELILLDLEYSWRTRSRQPAAPTSPSPNRPAGDPPSLDEYVARFPELGALNALSPQLVAQQYRVRQLWGDRPAREQFCQSMGRDDAAVHTALDDVDADLRARAGAATADLSAHADTPVSAGATGRDDGQIPDHIGRYTVRKRLGGGGFGVVYQAFDEELEQLVAIKVPRQDRFERSDTVDEFLEEARAAARIREHPGIVSVHDCGRRSDGVPYVVMENVEGKSLKKLLDGERLSHNRAAELALHITRAVHAIHKEGLVHRDLKPSNVLIDSDGLPRVTDFGLALHESTQRLRPDEFTGTLPYMSPEQVLGESQRLDGRTDIWAIGVMLYEMLVARRPFDGDTPDQLTDEILNREAKPLRQIDDSVPRELERICLKCLAKRISDRYTSAADVADDLEKWRTSTGPQAAESVGSAVRSVTDAPSTGVPTRRWPAALNFVIVSALLVAVVAWLAFRSADRRRPIAGPPSVTFDVLVSYADQFNVPLTDSRARPLRAGDKIRIEAHFSRPVYAYFIWIDGQGSASPVYPWRRGEWDNRPAEEAPVELLRLPPQGAWSMAGPKGMETLMLLARGTPLPHDVDFESLFEGLPKTPLRNPASLIWFRNGQPITLREDRTRAPTFDEMVELDDPLLRMQTDLYERLKEHFSLNKAVSFANSGEEEQ